MIPLTIPEIKRLLDWFFRVKPLRMAEQSSSKSTGFLRKADELDHQQREIGEAPG